MVDIIFSKSARHCRVKTNIPLLFHEIVYFYYYYYVCFFLQKFNSLKSPVFTISPLTLSSFTSSKVKKSPRESLDGLYLLSASHNENAIKVW